MRKARFTGHHIFAFERLSGMDRQTFSTKIIHYSQRPEAPSIK